MKSLLWFVGVCFIITIYALYPRTQINYQNESNWEVVDTHAYSDTLTFSERPSWVYPLIITDSVIGTVYNATVEQCDSDPDQLASGIRIDIDRAGEYRFCALSRDLLTRWGGEYSYGDTIMVSGAGKLSGVWIVHDTMNSRYTNRIDFLVAESITTGEWKNAKIRKVI